MASETQTILVQIRADQARRVVLLLKCSEVPSLIALGRQIEQQLKTSKALRALYKELKTAYDEEKRPRVKKSA